MTQLLLKFPVEDRSHFHWSVSLPGRHARPVAKGSSPTLPGAVEASLYWVARSGGDAYINHRHYAVGDRYLVWELIAYVWAAARGHPRLEEHRPRRGCRDCRPLPAQENACGGECGV